MNAEKSGDKYKLILKQSKAGYVFSVFVTLAGGYIRDERFRKKGVLDALWV